MKKGFTLIELLAVIVILAVIALISTPTIIGLIDNAKKEKLKDSAYGIVKAGELLYFNDLLDETNEKVLFTYTDGVETSSVPGKKLDYSGSKPKSGNVIINSEGEVAIAIHNGTYCAIKGFNDSEVILLEKSEECAFADTSGASIPELSAGMIPIKWDVTNNRWVKADVNNVLGSNQWYNYNAQEWANVVLVTEATRNTYKNASFGTVINEADVLAYLVWVPRYRYKLFNVEAASVSPQTIEIVFEEKPTTKSNGSTNGTWLTHPAFTFGTSEVNGIWVGKFETTGDASTPTVKPNVASLRNQDISTQFATSQLFNNTATYGTTNDFDSHMMNSMEWGAVTYLSNSEYGKNVEIWKNPSSSNITGRGGTTVSQSSTTDTSGSASNTLYSYDGKQCNTKAGYECTGSTHATYGMASSTTGNIYGIYDMSGGAWEFLMGVLYNIDNTTIMLGSSGFIQATIDSTNMSKYINKYTYGTTYNDQTAYNRRQLGDATGETRGWYSDGTYFVNDSNPWSARGGSYSDTTNAGAFLFENNNGGSSSNISFRSVQLKP